MLGKDLNKVSKDDLLKFLQRNCRECENIDYKTDLPKSNRLAEIISSFANVTGGYIFIGVEYNENDKIVVMPPKGVKSSRRLNDAIIKMCKEKIYPGLVLEICSIKISSDNEILIVYVKESQYIHIIKGSGLHVRIDDQTHKIPISFYDKILTKKTLEERIEEKLKSLNNFGFENKTGFGWINIIAMPYETMLDNIPISELDTIKFIKTNCKALVASEEIADCNSHIFFDKRELQHAIIPIFGNFDNEIFIKRCEISHDGTIQWGRPLINTYIKDDEGTRIVSLDTLKNDIRGFLIDIEKIYSRYEYSGKLVLCIKLCNMSETRLKYIDEKTSEPNKRHYRVFSHNLYTESILSNIEELLLNITTNIERSYGITR